MKTIKQKEMAIERNRRYRLNHPERIKEISNRYYRKHHQKILDNGKIYRGNNKKKIKIIRHNYYLKNKDKILAYNKEYMKNYRIINRERLLEYARKKSLKFSRENPEKKRELDRKYYLNNQKTIKEYRKRNFEKRKQYNRQYYLTNKDKEILRRIEYCNKNREKVRTYHRNYIRKKLTNDENYRIANNLRTRLRIALKGYHKNIATLKMLGCSLEELKKHLESGFKDGMSWENYGLWHIDHIKPLSIFNLTDEKQLLEVCNFNNLQPLWAKENISKSNKILPVSITK